MGIPQEDLLGQLRSVAWWGPYGIAAYLETSIRLRLLELGCPHDYPMWAAVEMRDDLSFIRRRDTQQDQAGVARAKVTFACKTRDGKDGAGGFGTPHTV